MVKSEISGILSRKDIKRLTGAARTGTVGPTTVYYAGVTAPIISAGVAVFSRNLLQEADYISAYWIWFSSALIAAFAGICWYLIFMRWSYRNTIGRGDEVTAQTRLAITDDALIMHRGHIQTTIDWRAILTISKASKHIALKLENNDTILVPNHWFGKDKAARIKFHQLLNEAVETRKLP